MRLFSKACSVFFLAIELVVLYCLMVLASQGSASSTKDPAAFNAAGPLYPVIEQDLLSHIEAIVESRSQSGELAGQIQKAQKRALAYVNEPPAVRGLVAARRSSSYLLDPTVVLARNVVDAQGNVLHKAGTRINPLTHVDIERRMLLFDERNAGQMRLAKRMLDSDDPPMAILVGGSPRRFFESTGARPYFDQGGVISRRLNLSEVPVLISQHGSKLRIDIVAAGN